MKDEAKALWLEGLRTDESPRAQHWLCIHGCYSTLGVLCRVAQDAGLEVPTTHGTIRTWGATKATRVLPPEVMEWAELPVNDPYIAQYWATITEVESTWYPTREEMASIIERSRI